MTTKQIHLKGNELFSDMKTSALVAILKNADELSFEPGDFIFREGQRATKFFIVRKGQVALEIFSSPKGPVVVETLGEGDVLGWSWLVAPHRWRFDAVARDKVKLVALDAKTVWDQCEKDHEMGYQMFKKFLNVVTERLEATRIRLLDLYGTQGGEQK